MAGTPKQISPTAYLGTAAANIYAPPASTIYSLIRQIHLCNVGTVVATFTLCNSLSTGVETAGTELFYLQPILPGSPIEWCCYLPMKSTNFLVGHSPTGTVNVTITVLGDQMVVP